MEEIVKIGNYTYYCKEREDGYYGLFFWYDDGYAHTTSYVQIEGLYDFIIKSKNLNYVRKRVKTYVDDFKPSLYKKVVYRIR